MIDNPQTKHDWDQIWKHFNRLQKRVMHDKTTKKEFMAEPTKDRLEFYKWMQRQCGSMACWM